MKLAYVCFGLFFLAAGICLFVYGIYEMTASAHFVHDTRSARALVERVQAYAEDEEGLIIGTVNGGRSVWVAFTTGAGQEIHTEVRQTVHGSLVTDPKAGMTVNVRYYPRNPSSARLTSFFELWFDSIFALVGGAAFSWCGLYFALHTLKHPPSVIGGR